MATEIQVYKLPQGNLANPKTYKYPKDISQCSERKGHTFLAGFWSAQVVIGFDSIAVVDLSLEDFWVVIKRIHDLKSDEVHHPNTHKIIGFHDLDEFKTGSLLEARLCKKRSFGD